MHTCRYQITHALSHPYTQPGDDVTDTASIHKSHRPHALTLTLSDEELPVARWALQGWTATFDEVVAKRHMPKPPPAPTLHHHTLRIPLHLDTLEELDYQFTIAMHDDAHRLPPDMDPAIGATLAQRIVQNLPPSIKLSS